MKYDIKLTIFNRKILPHSTSSIKCLYAHVCPFILKPLLKHFFLFKIEKKNRKAYQTYWIRSMGSFSINWIKSVCWMPISAVFFVFIFFLFIPTLSLPKQFLVFYSRLYRLWCDWIQYDSIPLYFLEFSKELNPFSYTISEVLV